MIYSIHRQAYSPYQPYRYAVTDQTGDTLYVIEPSDPTFLFAKQNIRVLDHNHATLASVQQPDMGHSPESRTYWINFLDEDEPRFGVEHTQSRVDHLLRRSPHFRLIGLEPEYIARGSRHGTHFYEIFDADDQLQAEIVPQWRGAAYTIESESPVLSQRPLLLSILTVAIDLHQDDD